MEVLVKAKKIGGSLGVIIPREVVEKERIFPEDSLNVTIEKKNDLDFLWAVNKDIKKSTKEIMKEIDEGENE
ncbi:MAG: hypothetical protein AABW50_04430 [Nanoarchaeota archaeon]